MRRCSLLVAFVLVLTTTIGRGAILADATPPVSTPIGQDGLTLYGFIFEEFNEVPWEVYEATMTVYVLAGAFAFYAESQQESPVIIQLPPAGNCLEIRTGEPQSDGFYLYEDPTQDEDPAPGSGMCVQDVPGVDCTEIRCILPQLDDPQAVILEAGSVLYLPADTLCFVCAIELATSGAAHLDITVRTEDAENSWARVATAALEATPGSTPESTPTALRLDKLPMKNPGGCAGRV